MNLPLHFGWLGVLEAALIALPKVRVLVALGQIAHVAAARAIGLPTSSTRFGHGAILANDIMRLLGVPDEMIADIHSQLRSVHLYKVVVSREKMVMDELMARMTVSDMVAEWFWLNATD